MAKNDLFNNQRATSPLTTQWLWFYVKVRMVIVIIMSFVYSINLAFDYSADLSNMYFLLAVIIQIVLLIYVFWVYTEMKRFTKRSFVLNRFLLIIEGLSFVLRAILSQANTPYYIISVVCALIWIIPNWIYFNKRRELFCDPPLTMVQRNLYL